MKSKLRFGLLQSFILFILIILAIDLCFYYFHESKREREKFNQYFELISDAISSEISRLSTDTTNIIKIIQHLYNTGKLNINDYKQLNDLLIPLMKNYPAITSINFGDEEGNGYLILNLGSLWKNRIKRAKDVGRVTRIDLNEMGQEISQQHVLDDYDPRRRPWYKIAKDNNDINWSSPYIFRTTKDVGITASCNLSKVKEKKVIIGLDIMLKDLSVYLQKAKKGYKDVSIKILSQDGKIIASSDENFKDFLKKDEVDLLTVTEKSDELLYKAYKTFFEKKAPLFSIDLHGELYYVSVKTCDFSPTKKYYAFITYPESAFLSQYKTLSMVRTALYFLIIVIFSLIFIKRFLVPLKHLAHSMEAFSIFDFKPLPYAKRKDEVGVLATTFSNMAMEIERQKRLIEESEKSYRLLFESNPLPFLIVEEETMKILKANEAAIKLYGYSSEEFYSLSLKDLEVEGDTKVALKIDGSTKGIVTHKRQDGSTISIEIHATSIPWEGKRALLILCIDISQRRLLEEQLANAKRLESLGTMAGGIAHDFNNILAAILGHASLLELKLPSDSPLVKHARDIIRSSERAAQLVAQMLAIGRKQMLRIEELDLNLVIQEFLPTLEMLLGNNVILETVLSKTPLKIKADKNQLGQVLMNLATNAHDAMPTGGKVTILTNRVFIKQEMIQTLEDGYYALLQFSDTGMGITEEVKRRIFDPFFTTKEVGKGTGLGLSVIYGIIRQHQGEIQVNSAMYKGTTFYIYLPLIKEEKT